MQEKKQFSNSSISFIQLCNDMLNFAMIPEVRELCFLLTRPHMRALFDSHDQLANGEYIPQLQDLPLGADEEDETVKIVRLVKGNEPLVGDGLILNLFCCTDVFLLLQETTLLQVETLDGFVRARHFLGGKGYFH